MKYILSIILVILSFQSLAISQSITGNSNNAIIGDNNNVKNNSSITKGADLLEYNSLRAKEDLENGNYKNVYFEEKKNIPLLPSIRFCEGN